MTASDEAKKALEGVTPGPWFCMDYTTEEPIMAGWYIVPHDAVGTIAKVNPHFDQDARFIAWCREGVPSLLAEIASKDAEIARLTAQPSPDVVALVEAVDHLLHNYLLDEHDEPDMCVDDDHWSAIHDAFTALARVKGGE